MNSNKKNKKVDHRKILPYALLLAIIIFQLFYMIRFVQGPSYYGDDNAYTYLAYMASIGQFRESGYIFSIRLLQIFPIAFFYHFFGVSVLSSAAWDIVAFLATVVIVFALGKELYNTNAGLIAALLFSFFPVVVKYASTVGDNLGMMMFASLSMLCILYGIKKSSRFWLALSGASVLAAYLVTPEGGIIGIVLGGYLLISLAARKIKISSILYVAIGFFAAIIVLFAVNYGFGVSPLITFTVNSHYFSALNQPNTTTADNTNLMYYPENMFPYRTVSTIGSFINSITNPVNEFGWYMYAFVISTAYLILKREKKAYFPLIWFTFGFLFLEFGPMHIGFSPFSYILIHRLNRFAMLIAAPIVLTISFAIAKFIERRKSKLKTARLLIASAVVLFIVISSVYINMFWYNTTVYETYDQMQIASYINALPNNTVVYSSSAFSNLYTYMRFDNISRIKIYDQIYNCSEIPKGVYVVIPKYVELFNLTYTPNPTAYCKNWSLVLYPKINSSYPSSITAPGIPMEADLYYT